MNNKTTPISITSKEALENAIIKLKELKNQSYPPTKIPINEWQVPFMKEQYSKKDIEFIEHHGRLLFLAFIKPIINGVGFDFKEVQVSEEKRLDVVITYNSFKYIIEMKIWRGEK